MRNKVNNLTYNEEELLENEEELNTSFNNEGIYPMLNIKVEKSFYSIFELKRKFDRNDKKIVLDSDFQRNSVWGHLQKSELIESILMGLPLPLFYFFEDKLGRLIVIDGRQRLTAFFEFLDNDFELKTLKILKEFSGKKFKDLDAIAQSKIEDYQIQANVIQPPTPDQIKFDIFDRVNRAGTQLNKQEIRNALYQGKSTQLLKEIVQTKAFSDATGNAFQNNSRMKDRYIILRFLAFEIYYENKLYDDKGYAYEYKNDIDDLLGKTMEYINKLKDSEVEILKKITLSCLEKSYFYLGNDGFRLIQNNRKSPINMNIFECLMHLMRKIPSSDEILKNDVKIQVNSLLQDRLFENSIRKHRDNWNNVKIRYSMIDKITEELKK